MLNFFGTIKSAIGKLFQHKTISVPDTSFGGQAVQHCIKASVDELWEFEQIRRLKHKQSAVAWLVLSFICYLLTVAIEPKWFIPVTIGFLGVNLIGIGLGMWFAG